MLIISIQINTTCFFKSELQDSASPTPHTPRTHPHMLSNSTRAANQPLKSPSATRTANPTRITTPTSPALSSNVSTPLTPSPQIPKFDIIANSKFSKSLNASLNSKDAVLKEVRDCILTNNESRLKAFIPFIHFYRRDLHVRSGCVCIDEKLSIPTVFREALIDDIHANYTGTWGMICMATHCWWH